MKLYSTLVSILCIALTGCSSTLEKKTMDRLYSLHVMPLLEGYEKELAEDAKMMIDNGICAKIACSMTLVPEGTPAVDKAAILAERYRKFKAAYKGDPSDIGILLQATIGHGWTPASQAPFQKIILIEGKEQYRMCPLDNDFRKYIDEQVSTLAKLKPDFFMVDDDFRFYTGHTGCFCPLHVAGFSAREGKNYTREELAKRVVEDEDFAKKYDRYLRDTLLELAGIIRNAIDRHAPGTPCSYCTCLGDARYSDEVAEILAGKGGKKMIRINNARYLKADLRTLPERMYQGKFQIASISPDTMILAETDTCPQNRWSTAAALLHSHYTASILEGCQGAKHWITSMSKHKPETGVKYREYLQKYYGFYEELARNVRHAKPEFFLSAVLPEKPLFINPFITSPAPQFCISGNFVNNIGVLGLPANFDKNPGNLPVMLGKDEAKSFSKEELEHFAAAGMIVDGMAAIELTRRGLSDLTGVQAEPWQGRQISCEMDGDTFFRNNGLYASLTPQEPANSRIVTKLFARLSGLNKEMDELAPGLILTTNKLGGKCAVYAGAAHRPHFNNFTWLDLDRKQQLLNVLKHVTGKDIPHVSGDNEVYLKALRLENGDLLFAFFNLAFDPMDEIPFVCPGNVQNVEKLLPDGSWQKIEYQDNVLKTPLMPAFPEIIRVRF
ncbi:MAG: hypothetical protein IJW17_09680 [Lentisphaeria bacterium]|nr:hypothetical protein [Lentisphaeria bacterium]